MQIPHERSETARKYRFADGAPGEIGLIAPVRSHFAVIARAFGSLQTASCEPAFSARTITI